MRNGPGGVAPRLFPHAMQRATDRQNVNEQPRPPAVRHWLRQWRLDSRLPVC